MIKRTHSKLTEIHDTTYHMNVHKQFVKNTLLSIENMFECVFVFVSIFPPIVVHMIQFDLSEPDISVHILRLISI